MYSTDRKKQVPKRLKPKCIRDKVLAHQIATLTEADLPENVRGVLLPEQYTQIIPGAYINAKVIKWHLADLTDDMERWKVILAFTQAINSWQPHFLPIKFESTSRKEDANIVINFAVNGDDDLPIPFERGVLGYAYAPINNRTQMWLNDYYDWAEVGSQEGIILKTVVEHEFGHCVNFGHTEAVGDIMEAIYNKMNKITADSIRNVEYTYGDLKRRIKAEQGEEEPSPEPPKEETPPTVDEDAIKAKYEAEKVLFLQKVNGRNILFSKMFTRQLEEVAEYINMDMTALNTKFRVKNARYRRAVVLALWQEVTKRANAAKNKK